MGRGVGLNFNSVHRVAPHKARFRCMTDLELFLCSDYLARLTPFYLNC